jgi:hypothetical protein
VLGLRTTSEKVIGKLACMMKLLYKNAQSARRWLMGSRWRYAAGGLGYLLVLYDDLLFA